MLCTTIVSCFVWFGMSWLSLVGLVRVFCSLAWIGLGWVGFGWVGLLCFALLFALF